MRYVLSLSSAGNLQVTVYLLLAGQQNIFQRYFGHFSVSRVGLSCGCTLAFQLASRESSPLKEGNSKDVMSGYRACDLFGAALWVVVP